jgi:hypothetical protein
VAIIPTHLPATSNAYGSTKLNSCPYESLSVYSTLFILKDGEGCRYGRVCMRTNSPLHATHYYYKHSNKWIHF